MLRGFEWNERVNRSSAFGLHRELLGAGAQSFLITPVVLNGKGNSDNFDERALCLRLSRWLDGNRDELAPHPLPSPEQRRKREGTRQHDEYPAKV